jgi:hypothetical protein
MEFHNVHRSGPRRAISVDYGIPGAPSTKAAAKLRPHASVSQRRALTGTGAPGQMSSGPEFCVSVTVGLEQRLLSTARPAPEETNETCR